MTAVAVVNICDAYRRKEKGWSLKLVSFEHWCEAPHYHFYPCPCPCSAGALLAPTGDYVDMVAD
ncbi:hypothetical protein TMSI_25370 [Klebsiella quasipneumoniae]|nr:hypothetical protein TMSI_25370 [Klebsiella quasipneumoniae]